MKSRSEMKCIRNLDLVTNAQLKSHIKYFTELKFIKGQKQGANRQNGDLNDKPGQFPDV
jgi:hypothetical protein